MLAKMADSLIQVSNEIYNTVGVANKKQKNKVFARAEHNVEVLLKVGQVRRACETIVCWSSHSVLWWIKGK